MTLIDTISKYAMRGLAKLPAALMRPLAGKPVEIDGQKLPLETQFMLKIAGMMAQDELPSPAEARAEMNQKGDWLAPCPKRPVATRDMTLPGGDGPCPARLYTPAAHGDAALLYFHGGGFVAGSLASHDSLCAALADAAECRIIALDYRLVPEHAFPAAADDAVAAFRGLVALAPDLGINPTRIAVGGDSAGGNLTALVAQECRHDPTPPVFQIMWVPWLDLAQKRASHRLFAKGYFLEDAQLDWYGGHYIGGADAANPRLSPFYGDVAGLCPTAIITAALDPLRDEGAAYAQRLREAGVAVEHRCIAGVPHVFMNVAGYIAPARAGFDQSVAIMRRALKGESE